MLKETDFEYAKSLILSNREQYPYYVLQSCTYFDGDSHYSSPQFKIYFSDKPITQNGNSYKFQGKSIVYEVVSSNANRYYYGQRIRISELRYNTVTIDEYEFVFSNIKTNSYTTVPDITATRELTQSHFDGVSLILICVILSFVVVKFLKG